MNILVCDKLEYALKIKDHYKGTHEIFTVENSFVAKEYIINKQIDIIISDLKENTKNICGIELLKILKASNIDIPVIIAAKKSNISLAVESLKLGAFDFIEKDNEIFTIKKLINSIDNYFNNNMNLSNRNKQKQLANILIVDDNQEFTRSIEFYFSNNYKVDIVNYFPQAKDYLENQNYDLIFLDINDETSNDERAGITLLEHIINSNYNSPVVMLSGWAQTSIAVDCLKIGAVDFVEKSLNMQETIDKVKSHIDNISNQENIFNNGDKNFKSKYRVIDIIGESNLIKNVRNEIMEVANHDIPVLLYGETGTGKEVAASSIHIASPRKNNNFIELDCSSIPDSIFESELFGNVKGAYTGAIKNRIGKMELAQGGTLFLDEIENLTLEQQAKLLRVLEDKTIYPIGSNEGKKIDFRLICATNIDLLELVKSGKFRQDLYYRLNVYKIEIPPLKERGEEDIVLLISHFLKDIELKTITKDSLELLKRYTWPGNIRELKNLLKKFKIIASSNNSNLIDYEIVKEGFRNNINTDSNKIKNSLYELVEYYNRNVPKMIKDFEDMAVIEAYKNFDYNISKVA